MQWNVEKTWTTNLKIKEAIETLIDRKVTKVIMNNSDDIRYTHILFCEGVEIGIDLEPVGEEIFLIKESHWNEF